MDRYIKSPLNYVGGKYKILSQILPLFPKKVDYFIEPFCGGLNVMANFNGEINIANDINDYLIEMYEYFKNTPVSELIKKIDEKIKFYNLSLSNAEGYNSLRNDYNQNKNPLDLFVLTCYSFNHQIRYNNNFKFNTPFGKDRSSYNATIKKNLILFVEKIQSLSISFSNKQFFDIDYSMLTSDSFVYCDPPYLISIGSYNDGKRGFGNWTEKEEKMLLELLDELNSKGTKFALSNVLIHKGVKNDILIEWAKKYKVHYINNNFNNSNYQSCAKEHETIEVLITNY